MIQYVHSAEAVTVDQLEGFFAGWPNPPTAETHLRLLRRSHHVVLAIDDGTRRVVGFVTALSDGVLSAYISLLEVLPDYRRRGIGAEWFGGYSASSAASIWSTSSATPCSNRSMRSWECAGPTA